MNEHQLEKNKEKCQLCDDKYFCHKVTLKMHLLELHELDFTKTSNTPFICDLFDIIKEPNVYTVPSAGIPCTDPNCQKMFSSNREVYFCNCPSFYCAVIYSVEQGLLIKMSIFTILIVTYKLGKCIFTTAPLDQKLANDK